MPKMQKKLPKRTSIKRRVKTTSFGPVSTINTAPVAIGNSVRGSAPVVRQVADGLRVVGRDFAFALSSSAASVTGWDLIGGMPISPAVLASSGLRAFVQSYAHFKVNRIMFHYITSSPTSQAGDILFYHERDRNSPCPDFSNSNFLPYVLSDHNTVLGPQWTNHSALIEPPADWKSTNYGAQTDLNEDAAGAVMLFSKTNAVNSPGYVIIDYDITFRELAVNPRAGALPVSRGLFHQTAIGLSAVSTTAGTTTYTGSTSGWVFRGLGVGGAAAAAPTGMLPGDVYKCVVSATASSQNTFTACTLSNLLTYPDDASTAVTLDDGFTFYACYDGNSSKLRINPTRNDSETSTRPFVAGVTGSITFALCVNMTLVAVTGSTNQSSY